MRSTTTLAALCAVTALALTACGTDDDKGGTAGKSGQSASASSKATPSSKKSKASGSELEKLTGPQIANKAMKAMQSATSLTTALDGTVDGGPMKYRMSSANNGECVGNMSFGTEGKVELIKTGDLIYMKFDRAFWKSQGGKDGAAAADTIGDRWTKSKASGSDFKDFASACDSDEMLSGFESGPNLARKGETTTVDGKPAITLIETDGDETYTTYVATEGKPYILKMVIKGGKEPGTVTFGDFDQPVDAKAPTGDIVDLDAP
ncbi:putative lipoprotein [Streptomyces bingchenggensis BCW-1]|uniref:Putative lipoprotein n=1 Tax=Streptomyces bingchenggensis (strain BCW-1) TaxID=749414 RepID=D7BXC6_STRBB|nr:MULTISPECIES: hypothetical protein [Streptomyces]ADI07699.1 putative lipoprotein [Streptomyces bingchenggensis BCW-1]